MSSQIEYLSCGQVALLLGKPRPLIIHWVNIGELGGVERFGKTHPTLESIAQFLFRHPEEVGRVYCDDLIPVLNEIRAEIVDILENIKGASELWPDTLSAN